METVYFFWTNVVSLIAGAAIVGFFWMRDRQEIGRRISRASGAVLELIRDPRGDKGGLLLNIVGRVKMGKTPALQDWNLLRGIVRAVFELHSQFWCPDESVHSTSEHPRRTWEKMDARVRATTE